MQLVGKIDGMITGVSGYRFLKQAVKDCDMDTKVNAPLTDEEKTEIFNDFIIKFLNDQEPCPNEYLKVLNENFSDLLA